MITARQPEHEDVVELALHMREIDMLEVRCFMEDDETIMSKITDGVRRSGGSLAFRDEKAGRVICIMGYETVDPKTCSGKDLALIWCLGTDLLPKHGVAFTRIGRVFIDAIVGAHKDGVYNVVHKDNKTSQEWLKRCGCHVFSGGGLEYKGEPFYWFQKAQESKPCVAQQQP